MVSKLAGGWLFKLADGWVLESWFAMRDLVGWNLPLGRWAGIRVRLHVFFVLLVVFVLHFAWRDGHDDIFQYVAAGLAILFFSVLAHELGHCYAARRLGGRVDQIVLWPLGGLAQQHVGHHPHEELIAASAGPLVNLALCVLTAVPLALFEPWPAVAGLLNPLQAPLWHEGFTWLDVLSQAFWFNWLLLLVNLLPAVPLDGGRILRALLWQKIGYRSAVQQAARVAQVMAVAILIAAWFSHQDYPYAPLPLALLGVLLFFSARQEAERQDRETEDGLFGYDFSQGYTSLEKQFDAPSRKHSPGPVRQWLQGRRDARQLRQQQIEQEDDRRVDDVLARLHETGRESLSEDDRALLDRVSARYRNRQRG